MKGINLTLAKVTSCDRWLVCESAVFLYTYLWSIEFNVRIQSGRNGRRKG